MEIKSDEEQDMEQPVERYENKVEEMNSIALISALVFGFSVTVWVEFEQELFANMNAILAYIFAISALTAIVSSALSAVMAISIAVALRRLMFKYGKETDAKSLRVFKRTTHRLRNFVRYFVYSSYLGLFIALAVYSHVKWKSADIGDFLFVLCYIILFAGLLSMVGLHMKVRSSYNLALKSKSKD
eukprot:UN02471